MLRIRAIIIIFADDWLGLTVETAPQLICGVNVANFVIKGVIGILSSKVKLRNFESLTKKDGR